MSRKESNKPVYYDGSGLQNVTLRNSSYKDYVIKPEGVNKGIVYPCFPYLDSNK
ncbi:hypothetical protein [Halalkalibacter alkaliphilus]|uniref:Uncharacterized protein n=1 Tax=Halalkalibacter alkaliphilus TaxID=2917993 RepID=A0A9X2CX38_9BACI|nr:hypothetical protein [Halalkalibacter alkaliphilus]MCL7749832.1 hypothetical protein [Halalkalibacter alkaliphilus]